MTNAGYEEDCGRSEEVREGSVALRGRVLHDAIESGGRGSGMVV